MCQAKVLNQGYPSAGHKELFKFNRNGMRKVTGYLIGHCPLKMHLTVMGIKNGSSCRNCHENEETTVHILCESEAYCAYRFEYRGGHLLKPWELRDIFVRCLFNFSSTTDLF